MSRKMTFCQSNNSRKLHQGLECLDMTAPWREYRDTGHWVNEPQGMDDVIAFLKKKPPKSTRQ
jgi:hypothetical protein